MRNARLIAGVLCSCTILGGCGGGGGGHHGSIVPVNQSPGGIWKGTDSQTGQKVVGIVTEDGQFIFIRADRTQYVGKVTMSGTSGSGSFDGFAPFGTTFADGSSHGTGTVAGTIQQRSSFAATTEFTSDGGTPFSDSLSMNFNTLYNQPSSLATVAGNYTDTATGTVFSVNGDGRLFAQDATSSCVVTGTVSIINPSYNAYDVSISYASCAGANAVLNGLTLTGIGTLDNTVTPVQAVIGLSNTIGAPKVALVEILDRS